VRLTTLEVIGYFRRRQTSGTLGGDDRGGHVKDLPGVSYTTARRPRYQGVKTASSAFEYGAKVRSDLRRHRRA